MICALAFCPHPPLLVPEVAAGAAPELDPLRAACDKALAAALATGPDQVVLLGVGPATGELPADAVGSLRPYGVPLEVPLDPGRHGGTRLPLSLTMGAWLLGQSGWTGPRRAYQVDVDPMGGPGGRRAVADEVVALPGRTVLVVLADVSTKRTAQAPGAYDPAGEAFDARVAEVLAGGDPAAGRRLEYEAALAVGAQGWSAWRTAFHAARREAADPPGPWQARLLADEAPYGVGYLVAVWT